MPSGSAKSRYELKSVLGQGGMGVVYLAFDKVLRREVALKTLRDAPSHAALDLFARECQALATLSHPNIVEILDIGQIEQDGKTIPFFVMPLLRGSTLTDLIHAQTLTIKRVIGIVSQICRGLQIAHDRGLIHGDIKPSNIFVLEDDSAMLIDFGVAQLKQDNSAVGFRGTLHYQAPEQILLKAPSHLADIFSLGVVAYEAMTGRRPFDGPSGDRIADAILHSNPALASDLNSEITFAISQVLHTAMAKEPGSRFETAREFGDTIQMAERNEFIPRFDPVRFRPRLESAQRALEQGQYRQAAQLLAGVEAEGYVDPAVSSLRNQVNKRIKDDDIRELLEQSRLYFSEGDYALALQKAAEVLKIDAANSAALALQVKLREQRSEEAVRNVARLLSAVRQALNEDDVSAAKSALTAALRIDPENLEALSIRSAVSDKERPTAIEACVAESRALQVEGDLQSALARVEQALQAYPQDSRLAALRESLVARHKQSPPESTETKHFDGLRSTAMTSDREKELFVDQCLAEAVRLQADGNSDAALLKIKEARSRYPHDRRLSGFEDIFANRSPSGRPSIGLTALEAVSPPSGFLSAEAFSASRLFSGGKIEYTKIRTVLQFYRDHLNQEYQTLSRQARFTYILWIGCVLVSLGVLIAGFVLMFRGQLAAGGVTAVNTALVYFISRVFQQREDHYRSLASAKNSSLEYGNHCLLVIESIDIIEDSTERIKLQAHLVEVLTSKLKQPGQKAGRQPTKMKE